MGMMGGHDPGAFLPRYSLSPGAISATVDVGRFPTTTLGRLGGSRCAGFAGLQDGIEARHT